MKKYLWIVALLLVGRSALAQPVIKYITPDAAAPGMTVAVELIGDYTKTGGFGTDGLYFNTVQLVNAIDTQKVLIGPQIVSWNGRAVQFMLFVRREARAGTVELTVAGASNSVFFEITDPLDLGILTGNVTIVAGQTRRNTIVVDSLVLSNGTFTFPKTDIDLNVDGNQAYLPTRILSFGPIRLINAQIDVSGQSAGTGHGGNGGPGGGGGGGGMPANGGDGYTGGGGVGEQSNHNVRHGGVGTDGAGAHYYDGGSGLSGVPGGEGTEHGNPLEGNDEGGGGGTGQPFGKSGSHGAYKLDSPPGGFGGGSGGGTATSSGTTNFGGGGGGYATNGSTGEGNGDNSGHVNGNEMLVPLGGGSGGGAGNVAYGFLGAGGSGGGGGGAIEFASFRTFEFQSGSVLAHGGNGSDGASGIGENGAGGGGGSGGAAIVSARDSIVVGSSTSSPVIDVTGGTGGSGYKSGGSGGLGRVRLDGFISATTGNALVNKYFTPGKDYSGPAIQTVQITATGFTVYGACGTFGGPTNLIHLYYAFRSDPSAWTSVVVTPTLTSGSYTPTWVAGAFTRPVSLADSEIYIVALQDNLTPGGGTYADEPRLVMTHVSAYLAKIVRAPKSALNITSIDFGIVRVGECKDSFVTVTNTGDAVLSITSETFGDARFTAIDALPIRINPGESSNIRIRFCPRDTTVVSTVDLMRSNSAESPQSIALTGKGKQSVLSVPMLLDFGNVPKGTCKDSAFYVVNRGNDSLTITTETLSNPKFSAVSPALPVTLTPYDSALFTFRYCSNDTGAERSDGTITAETSHGFVLTAHTSLGSLRIDSLIDLGCVITGRPAFGTAYIHNDGNGAVHGLTAAYLGPDGVIVRYPAPDIAPNSVDSVIIELSTNATGAYAGSVHLTWTPSSDVEGTSSDIRILAHVSEPAKIEVLRSGRIDFDTVDLGSTRGDSCIQITNYSCEAIGVSEVLVQGGSAFTLVNSNATGQLVDPARWTYCLAFTPSHAGADSAVVRFRTGSDTTAPIVLRGYGLGPESPVVLSLDTLYATPGQVVPMHVRIMNDIASAGITTITFRVFFDPMQLDLNRSAVHAIGNAATSKTVTDVVHSIGDHEITVTSSQPFAGNEVLAELPFEVLLPSANTAKVALGTATFGSARATLSLASPGEIHIVECDTTERIQLQQHALSVAQNNPNPFGPRTAVAIDVTAPGFVTVRVLNVLGEEVARPFAGTMSVGTHAVNIDARSLPAGAYQYVVDWTDGVRSISPIRKWMNVVR